MTPAQILASIRYQVYETTAAFWGDAEVYQYMWDAECQMALGINCNEKTGTLTSSASVQEYDLDSIVIT